VSAGIALVRLAAEHAGKDPELEPFSDRTRVAFNQVDANGLDPHPEIQQGYGRGADLMWDGTGAGNCADLPDAATRGGAPLERCRPPSVAMPVPAPGRASATAPVAIASTEVVEGPVVRIRGMRFDPREIEIEAGATVTWINEDAVTHTVTSGVGTTPTSAPLASPFLARGATWQFTFEQPGDYEYLCLPHLDQAPMRGAHVRVSGKAR
jgi:plastocyanin